jgi:hypothetical protein
MAGRHSLPTTPSPTFTVNIPQSAVTPEQVSDLTLSLLYHLGPDVPESYMITPSHHVFTLPIEGIAIITKHLDPINNP